LCYRVIDNAIYRERIKKGQLKEVLVFSNFFFFFFFFFFIIIIIIFFFPNECKK